MLSAEQLIIVAYTHNECEVICRECGESGMEIMGRAMSAYEAGEWAGSEGLMCEECSKEIIGPYTWTCPVCDTEYTGEEAREAESRYQGWGRNSDDEDTCCDECVDPDEDTAA